MNKQTVKKIKTSDTTNEYLKEFNSINPKRSIISAVIAALFIIVVLIAIAYIVALNIDWSTWK